MKTGWLQWACVTLLFLFLSGTLYPGEISLQYNPGSYGGEGLEKIIATLSPGLARISPGQEGQQEKRRERQVPPVEARPVTRPSARAEKPEWKVGYQWEYAWKGPGKSGSLTREIIREDTFEGIPSYVVRVGTNEHFYAKDLLGLLASTASEKRVFKRNPPSQLLSWPLVVGKEWKDIYVRENIGEKSSQTFNYRTMVAHIEEVKVPAGTFEAFKIETYGLKSDNLVAEYWYSPKAKWFVKERMFHHGGVLERELTSFKID